MKNYKKFSTYFFIFLVVITLFHAFIWFFFTQKILTNTTERHVGDMSRLGYLVKYAQIKKDYVDLPKVHVPYYRLNEGPFDLVTLGDSFSNGGCGGKNGYYQDYIVSIDGLKVLNLINYKDNSVLQTANLLAKNGYLKKLKVKALIIERVDRYAVQDLGGDINPKQNATIDEMENFYKTKKLSIPYVTPKLDFFNQGNLEFLLYSLFYNFSDHPKFSKIVIKGLSRPLFNGKDGNKLLFYYEEVSAIKSTGSDGIKRINDNLDALARVLKDQGIKLYYMTAPDKYAVYYPYIVNNPYPKPVLSEGIRPLSKEYELIDSQAILAQALQEGQEDIYYFDDSHWTWKASKRIVGSVRF